MSNENETLKVFTAEDLVQILGISKNSVYELLRSKKIHSVKIGRIYRIPRSALEDYLKSAA